MRRPGNRSTFDLFDPRTAPGSLAGLRTEIMLLLSAAIRGAHLDRYDVAARMSRFLAEDVPKTMLDAYSAESRLDHNIPAYRFLAFMAATECYPDVNRMLRRLGCVILVGDDAELAAIAELEVERDALDRRIRTMKKTVRERRRG